MKLRFTSIICFIVTLTLHSFAFALDLDSAKASGLVGEKPNGYIGTVSSAPTPEATALVQDINQKRKDAYLSISKENSQPVNIVETLAAQKLIERLVPGQYYQNAQGTWVKK